MNDDNVTYLDSFRAEYFNPRNKNIIANKDIETNNYRIQANDSIMCGYVCIGFIDFLLKGKIFVRLYQFNFSKQIWKGW